MNSFFDACMSLRHGIKIGLTNIEGERYTGVVTAIEDMNVNYNNEWKVKVGGRYIVVKFDV